MNIDITNVDTTVARDLGSSLITYLCEALDATRVQRDKAEAAVARVGALCDAAPISFLPLSEIRAALWDGEDATVGAGGKDP